MNAPTMLYRCPGAQSFEGVSCETAVVDESEVQAKLAEGWHRDWMQADQAHKAQRLQANEKELAEVGEKLAQATKPRKAKA